MEQLTHKELKERYLRYRERARELYTEEHDAMNRRSITVTQHAQVSVCEDGAFVEATVWVPASELQPTFKAPCGATFANKDDMVEHAQTCGDTPVHEHDWRLGTLGEFPKGYAGCSCGALCPYDPLTNTFGQVVIEDVEL